MGRKVVIIDADFGMANIEVLFGVVPRKSLLDVLNGNSSIEDVIMDGPNGIKFISGGSGFTDMAALSDRQLGYLLETFAYLDSMADFILIDTGAGASNQVVNLVRASKETIIVTTPEPTSLTDAYAMIKIIKEAKFIVPEMFIVINRIENKKEGEDIYLKLNRVSHRFLGLELKLLGYIPHDDLLIKAVKQQRPCSILYPKSSYTKSMTNISTEILYKNTFIYDDSTSAKGFLSRLAGIFK
jgi:flagellar biosynthesis protein FlhG